LRFNTYSDALKRIKHAEDADFYGPASEALIARAEGVLGLAFPASYRAFLASLGCGGIVGLEFYGLINDDFEHSSVPDAVWLSLNLRRTTSAPNSLVVVSDTGDGGYYAVDTARKDAQGESPVVEWWPGLEGAEGNGRVVASDFGAFFLDSVRQAIDPDVKG
jgi:hypothetical protein